MRRTLPIFYSALLLTAVNLLLRFVSTSFQVHISSVLGAEGVGLLQLVLSVGGLATTVGMAGIRTATMYLTAEELGQNRPQRIRGVLRGCFLYSILFSSCVSLTVWFGAPLIADGWIGNLQTVGALRLYALFLPLVCLTGCMTGYFTAANRIGTLAAIEIAEQMCYMAVTMMMLRLWAGGNAEKACEAVVLGAGISSLLTLLCLTALHHRDRLPRTGPTPMAARLSKTALPLALADNLKVGINTTENLMVPKRLALHKGESSPLASFGTVTGMVFPVLMFPAAILFGLAELLIPELARCNAAGSRMRIRYLVRRGVRVALLYGCLSGGILYLTAMDLCTRLYGSDTAGHYLMLYSLLAPMLYCDAITDAMIKGLGQQTASVRYNILTSAMDVAFLFVLLPKYGMKGYLFSFFVTHLINFLLSIRRLMRISGVHLPIYKAFFTLSATAAAALLAAKLSSPAGKVLVFLPAVVSLWVLCGVIGMGDLRWIKGLLRKK